MYKMDRLSSLQGRSQPHSPEWARVPLSSFFPQSLINFSYFFSDFTCFLPHLGHPGGRVTHPGRPWLRHWFPVVDFSSQLSWLFGAFCLSPFHFKIIQHDQQQRQNLFFFYLQKCNDIANSKVVRFNFIQKDCLLNHNLHDAAYLRKLALVPRGFLSFYFFVGYFTRWMESTSGQETSTETSMHHGLWCSSTHLIPTKPLRLHCKKLAWTSLVVMK